MDFNTLTLRHPRTLLRLARKKLVRIIRGEVPEPEPAPPADPDRIDVRELIARSSLDELNRKAEEYFSSLTTWDYHLAKPFSTTTDAPALLINFATMIQGLNIAPGLRLVDFGSGTGWTSRYLTQLGCEVVLLDVSATALEIARELYRRQPVIGTQPTPIFLHFDGRKIDLPDASVDRILCFDAFHHAIDPGAMLAEFARILRPGGIAAFAEPGPEHSKTDQSQFEMKTYGVVENDVDIHAIWARAQEAGFDQIRVAAYHIPPYHVTLEQYDDLLAGGETYLRWAELTRAFLGNVRNFFLKRAGEEALDSRRTEGLAAEIEVTVEADRARAGAPIPARARVTNSGRTLWLPSRTIPGGVSLGAHLSAASGAMIDHDYHWQDLTTPPRPVLPGETLELSFEIPPLGPGEYRLEFDCVSDRVCWFKQVGSKSVTIPLTIA
ncbi:MAG TPA: class I SAM-dependent methyltransferase [Thermoanaerobaculia bacterium]|nr:class I SAM-dependent methyltransferase [Thermoanaerobaculia bacterium]